MISRRLLARSDLTPAGYREISPLAALHHLFDLRLVDVREADEYLGPLGHIAGAELVPVSTIAAAATGWERDRPILVICRSGARSARAATTLAAMGFRALFNLTGGMLAWEANGLPALRGEDTPLARIAAHVHACFVASAGGDVALGTRAFLVAAGTPADTPDAIRRALHALATSDDAQADERAEWVARFERRLAEVA